MDHVPWSEDRHRSQEAESHALEARHADDPGAPRPVQRVLVRNKEVFLVPPSPSVFGDG